MDDLAAVVILLTSGLAGLVLIPLGLPGLWLELLEAWVGFRFAQRYGGSSRAGWGALVGGLVGAVFGVPIPLIGSVIGGFLGAFAGAALFEYSRARRSEGAVRAGWGAVLGRAVAAAVKMAIGVVLVVTGLFLALSG
jgi:uncharacterized protein YqgC (DUF456 family)